MTIMSEMKKRKGYCGAVPAGMSKTFHCGSKPGHKGPHRALGIGTWTDVVPLVTEKDTEYYPLKSSDAVKDMIGRVRSWLDALEKPNTQFSRWQVAKDLIDLAVYVMYDDAERIGRVQFARELLKRQRKEEK